MNQKSENLFFLLYDEFLLNQIGRYQLIIIFIAAFNLAFDFRMIILLLNVHSQLTEQV